MSLSCQSCGVPLHVHSSNVSASPKPGNWKNRHPKQNGMSSDGVRLSKVSAAPTETMAGDRWTSNPFRNRIRVVLDAPVSNVWRLMGDLTRFPEYCSGLTKVDAITDENSRCTEYVCHFRPQEIGGEVISQRRIIDL